MQTYVIIRQTEIAPAWFASPVEIGTTRSATAATTFVDAQNAATMDPNRTRRALYGVQVEGDTAPTHNR